MDYDKLIERLKQKDGLWCSVPTGENLIADAATALSTLQAENAQLRDKLEQVKAERDTALEDLSRIKSCVVCRYCNSTENPIPETCKNCEFGSRWEWRGQKKD